MRAPEFVSWEEKIWNLLRDRDRVGPACMQKDAPPPADKQPSMLLDGAQEVARAAPTPKYRSSRSVPSPAGLRRPALGTAAMAFVLLSWQLAASTGAINVSFSSSPYDIVHSAGILMRSSGFWIDVGTSGFELAVGFALAAVFGIVIGILVGWYKDVDAVPAPFVSGLYATPRISLAPLLVVWLGVGTGLKIALVTLSAIFPVIISTATGTRTTDRQYVRVGRSFGAGDWVLFGTIAIPAAVPHIVSGLRLGSGLGIIGVVVAELIAGNAGVGYRMLLAGQTFQVADMFACLLVFTATGAALSSLFPRLERRFDAWRAL